MVPLLPIPLRVSVLLALALLVLLPPLLPVLVSASPLVVACPLDSVALPLALVARLLPVPLEASLRVVSLVRRLLVSLGVEDPLVDLVSLTISIPKCLDI
jgi:hypothetical protein